MRTVLAVVCSFTVLLTVYLSLSLAILHPPRANYQQWFVVAPLFLVQSVLTLAAIFGSGRASTGWIRGLLVAGGAAVIWVGASAVSATVAGPHFEGYAVVLGSALVVQGALTLALFLWRHGNRISRPAAF